MKRYCPLIVLVCLFVACTPTYRVCSPDGGLELTFSLTDEGQPAYAVSMDGRPVIDASPLGLIAEEVALDRNFKVLAVEKSSCDQKWETVWGEERWITDKHNELLVKLKHKSGERVDIAFRVFDDGFAFRYSVPQEAANSHLTILDEKTGYRFAGNPQAWSIPWRTEYYEGLWSKVPLSQKTDTLCSPVTLELPDGGYAFVHEAALRDYPAQNFYYADGALRTYLTPWLDENAQPLQDKAYLSIPSPSPWRMVILARDLKQFAELGYLPQAGAAVDMFTHTAHCEVVVSMSRAGSRI